METGIILSQTDLKKLLAKLLKVDEKQIIDDKYKEKEETEQLNTEVNSNEQIEQPLEENVEE